MQSHGLSIIESVLFDIWDCENKKGQLFNDFPFHRKKCMYGERKEYVSYPLEQSHRPFEQIALTVRQTIKQSMNVPAEQTDGTDV